MGHFSNGQMVSDFYDEHCSKCVHGEGWGKDEVPEHLDKYLDDYLKETYDGYNDPDRDLYICPVMLLHLSGWLDEVEPKIDDSVIEWIRGQFIFDYKNEQRCIMFFKKEVNEMDKDTDQIKINVTLTDE